MKNVLLLQSQLNWLAPQYTYSNYNIRTYLSFHSWPSKDCFTSFLLPRPAGGGQRGVDGVSQGGLRVPSKPLVLAGCKSALPLRSSLAWSLLFRVSVLAYYIPDIPIYWLVHTIVHPLFEHHPMGPSRMHVWNELMTSCDRVVHLRVYHHIPHSSNI